MADLMTIREAADICGLKHEALRRRVDRGTVGAVKGRDGVRRIPQVELERVGLWPGSEPPPTGTDLVNLRAELADVRHQLVIADARAEAEQRSRLLAEHDGHRARAAQQTADARHTELLAETDRLRLLEAELRASSPLRAWKLARARRKAAATEPEDAA